MQKSYYIFSNGGISRSGNTLRLCTEEGLPADVPAGEIYDIFIFGQVLLNTEILNFLSKNNIAVHFYNYYDYYIGSYYPRESNISGSLLVRQSDYFRDGEKRLALAKSFVRGASENMLRNLIQCKRFGYGGLPQSLISDSEACIKGYAKSADKARSPQETEDLLASIKQEYYSVCKKAEKSNAESGKGVIYGAGMAESLVPLFYSVLYGKVVTEIYKTQLNPAISYLHEPFIKRFSLSLDVCEIFRPLIADRFIYSLLYGGGLSASDFEQVSGTYKLTDAAFKTAVKKFEETLNSTFIHKGIKKEISYKYLIRLELYKLIKHITGDKNYEPYIIQEE